LKLNQLSAGEEATYYTIDFNIVRAILDGGGGHIEISLKMINRFYDFDKYYYRNH